MASLTHTLTHTGKSPYGTSGTRSAKENAKGEGKGLKTPVQRCLKGLAALRNQQVGDSSFFGRAIKQGRHPCFVTCGFWCRAPEAGHSMKSNRLCLCAALSMWSAMAPVSWGGTPDDIIGSSGVYMCDIPVYDEMVAISKIVLAPCLSRLK